MTHRISPDVFAALAAGGGGTEAIRQLRAARRSKNMLLLRAVLDLVVEKGHPSAGFTLATFELLSRMQKQAPEAVAGVLGYPLFGAWVLRTAVLLDQDEIGEAEPDGLASFAAAAAVRGSIGAVVELPPGDQVRLPSIGVAHFPNPTGEPIRLVDGALSDGRTNIPIRSGSPHWTPIPRISAEHHGLRLDLAVDDLGAHRVPDSITIADRLADQNIADEWRYRIGEGWRILAQHHREVAVEVAAAVNVLAPLAGSAPGQLSATFNDSFGCVAMSLPADARSTALTFAHEVQHAKLSALMDLFPLIKPGDPDYFYSPWRKDPRPASGLLQGIYAYLGVTGFWRRQYRAETDEDHRWQAEVEFARWRTAGRDAAHDLANSTRLTPTGRTFLTGTRQVLDAWHTDRISPDAQAEANRRATEHRRHWLTRSSQAP
ncbi:HEXXH motif domain-containing protein [Saccharopolyspora sp. K220]|uniref:HEXXH motif domain-containing protein n=1 Tax=Saccharopolyspora soli TaxID=2926618 RepID=UPI001F5A7C50|nr:HEXXH motif domain-containing protein [Saccharopolyspora soli]MCI2418134.1 HEXXH motif domain-containing protein [Saccharopolyspora soli]